MGVLWDDFWSALGETWAYLYAFPVATAAGLWFGVVMLVALAAVIRLLLRCSRTEVLWPLICTVVAMFFYWLSSLASGAFVGGLGFICSFLTLTALSWAMVNIGRAVTKK